LIVAGIGPELSGLDAASAGIKHGRGRLVRKQSGPRLSLASSRSYSGRRCQAVRPTQSASLDRSRSMPWPCADLILTKKRQMISIFREQNLRGGGFTIERLRISEQIKKD
jgi:hypothetical protein